jgi:hypothetical protein
MAFAKGDLFLRLSSTVAAWQGFTGDGQFLKRNSAVTGGWELGSAGGSWATIKTIDANNDATISFVNGVSGVVMDSTYRNYCVLFDTIVPSTDNVDFFVRTTTNAGSSWDSGASDYTGTSGGTGTQGYVNQTAALGSSTGENFCGFLYLFNPAGTTKYKVMRSITSALSATPSVVTEQNTIVRNAIADIDGIQFYMGSGNIASGRFTLLGEI